MNTLKRTGAALIFTSAFFVSSCSAEQTIDTNQDTTITHESIDPSQSTSLPSATLPALENPRSNLDYENRQRLSAILGQACTYVVEQGNKVTEGFPNVWSPQSPLRDFSKEYKALVQTPRESTYDIFDIALRQACDPYAAIYSKNNG